MPLYKHVGNDINASIIHGSLYIYANLVASTAELLYWITEAKLF